MHINKCHTTLLTSSKLKCNSCALMLLTGRDTDDNPLLGDPGVTNDAIDGVIDRGGTYPCPGLEPDPDNDTSLS